METYCLIELTRGQMVRVSPEDFDDLAKYRWHARWDRGAKAFYAARGVALDGRVTKIQMHRQIMGSPTGFLVDHINGDTLDNRRENLRVANNSQNTINSRISCVNTSGHKGVVWFRDNSKWVASIQVNKKRINLGSFSRKDDAIAARKRAEGMYHGEFARAS